MNLRVIEKLTKLNIPLNKPSINLIISYFNAIYIFDLTRIYINDVIIINYNINKVEAFIL
jgi:hypothetical protein